MAGDRRIAQPLPPELLACAAGGIFTVISGYDALELTSNDEQEVGYLRVSEEETVEVPPNTLDLGGRSRRYAYYVYGSIPSQPERGSGWIPTKVLAPAHS